MHRNELAGGLPSLPPYYSPLQVFHRQDTQCVLDPCLGTTIESRLADISRSSVKRTAPIRLLIVERRPIVREGVGELIAGMPDIELAAAVADSVSALRLARQLPLDVVLLSTSIQGRGFFDTLKRIRAARPEVPVVVLGGRCGVGPRCKGPCHGRQRIPFGRQRNGRSACGRENCAPEIGRSSLRVTVQTTLSGRLL